MTAEDRFTDVRERQLSSLFIAIGLLWLCYQLYGLVTFIHLHFIHRSSLDRYQGSAKLGPAWALVTGASDGIGYGFAEELCDRGFNVVLHGRNEKKLQDVRLKLLEQWPQREIRIMVIDAEQDAANEPTIAAAAAHLADINFKVLVNNVGGSGGTELYLASDKRSASETAACINVNSQFPTQITRVMLPYLIKNTPALILNIGSGAGEAPIPYASVYSGSKAYNRAWSRSLRAEMKAENHDVESICLLLGMVATKNISQGPSLFVPSPRRMAKSCLDVVGCGRGELWAHWTHAIQFGSLQIFPGWILEKIIIGMVLKEKAAIQEKRVKT